MKLSGAPKSGSRRPVRARASALIAVLAIVVLLSIMMVGLFSAMRMERQASHYSEQNASADLMARQGVECVKAALQTATASNNYWASGPGYIYYHAPGANGLTAVSLFSGIASASSGVYAPPDMNKSVISDDSQTVITGTNTSQPMTVAWVYVHQSGKLETASPPTITATDPVVGRFAFWTDDESARLDLNTAWQRGGVNTTPINNPSQVSLLAIPEMTTTEAGAIQSNAVNNAPYTSPDEARRLSGDIATNIIAPNRFSLTHAAYSANLNPWGEPKIYLTTKSNNLPPEVRALTNYTNYYLNILADETLDPGVYIEGLHNAAGTNYASYLQYMGVLNRLINKLTNTFPYSGNATFTNKYGLYAATVTALNIVEYVRSVESTSISIPPFLVNPQSSLPYFTNSASSTTNIIAGAARRPMVAEMAASVYAVTNIVSGTTTNAEVFGSYEMKICFPTNYFTTNVLNKIQVHMMANFPVLVKGVPPNEEIGYEGATPPGAMLTSATKISRSGEFWYALYKANTTNIQGQLTNNDGALPIALPTTLYLSAIIESTDKPALIYDQVSVVSGHTSPDRWAVFGTNYGGVPITNTQVNVNTSNGDFPMSVQISDPRMPKFQTSWTYTNSAFTNGPNNTWFTNVNTSPPQDTTNANPLSSDTLTDIGVNIPYGTGMVHSVAELGYIFTGVPWRSLRMQPSKGITNPPDWALMDVFAAPPGPTTNIALYHPGPGTNQIVAGRVNVNGQMQPVFPGITRTIPLQALFLGSTNESGPATNSAGMAATIATNIASLTLAINGTNYGGVTNALVSAGELAEIQGVADQGKASEVALQGVADLATVQGNSFRVYCIGQAIRQTPGLQLSVEAERRVEAIIVPQQIGTSYSAQGDTNPSAQTILWKIIPQ